MSLVNELIINTAPFQTKSMLDIFGVTVALMFGTAGLPHVITRFYTAPPDAANEASIDRAIIVLADPKITQLAPFVIALVVAGGLAADALYSFGAARALSLRGLGPAHRPLCVDHCPLAPLEPRLEKMN